MFKMNLKKEPAQQPKHRNYTALAKELFAVDSTSIDHLDQKRISG